MFNEENTVEKLALDTFCGGMIANRVGEESASYGGEIKGWRFVATEELPVSIPMCWWSRWCAMPLSV